MALSGIVKHIFEKGTMQLRSTRSEAAAPEAGTARFAAGLPIDRAELEKLARWIPAKEMALLFEIFDRARSDPDLTRPALLLCSAYAERVARMLDQDPLPTVTKRIKDRLEELRERHGL
jgi:hypothetical protein